MADRLNVPPQNVPGSQLENQYSNPEDRFWSLYLLDAEKEDTRLAERWKGDADGILIFTGLFATTVGSFIIATYPNLQPSSADQSAAALLIITQQLDQITRLLASPGSSVPLPALNLTDIEAFSVPSAAIKVNILWIISFFLSLFCALLATLVQQWSRNYIGYTQRRGSARNRGLFHSFLRVGIDRFGFNHTVDAIIALLHISVSLFTAGFIIFIFNLNGSVPHTLAGLVAAAAAFYIVLSILPLQFLNCPFSTPLTPVLKVCCIPIPALCFYFIHDLRFFNLPFRLKLSRARRLTVKLLTRSTHAQLFKLCGTEPSFQQPAYVLEKMTASLDELDEIYDFTMSLPSYFKFLRHLGYDADRELWPRFSSWGLTSPYIHRLLPSFSAFHNPGLDLTPRKINQLVYLALFANAAGVEYGTFYTHTSKTGLSIVIPSKMRVLSRPMRHYSSWWDELARDQNPVVSFLSLCLLSSVYVVHSYGTATLDKIKMFDDLTALTSFPKLHSSSSDNLLKHLIPYNGYFLNVYRLLFFIRTILHYATLPESPVMNHQTIWLPVLQGLHDVTMNIDFHFLPREARADIWKVLHTVGRSDLVPYEERGPLEAQPKLDYSSVFEQFPVIGGTLRSLTNAIVMQNNDQHVDDVMDRASAPAIMLHDEDAVAIEMESNDAGGGFLQSGGNVHRRSYPLQGHSPDCFAQHDNLLKLQNEPSQSL